MAFHENFDVNPIGKVDMETMNINATTIYSCMAEIKMAVSKVDTVTGLVWDKNDSWDTTSNTGGDILLIKEEEEEGEINDGIIWDVDDPWV